MKKVFQIIRIIINILTILNEFGENVDKNGNGIPDVIDDVISALKRTESDLKAAKLAEKPLD